MTCASAARVTSGTSTACTVASSCASAAVGPRTLAGYMPTSPPRSISRLLSTWAAQQGGPSSPWLHLGSTRPSRLSGTMGGIGIGDQGVVPGIAGGAGAHASAGRLHLSRQRGCSACSPAPGVFRVSCRSCSAACRRRSRTSRQRRRPLDACCVFMRITGRFWLRSVPTASCTIGHVKRTTRGELRSIFSSGQRSRAHGYLRVTSSFAKPSVFCNQSTTISRRGLLCRTRLFGTFCDLLGALLGAASSLLRAPCLRHVLRFGGGRCGRCVLRSDCGRATRNRRAAARARE